ncbi:MAG: S41 family peptidase [Pyrinomonadaceae bacterium]|nr:S41 family peptidase [Pyrinomonadaceae bacterium]
MRNNLVIVLLISVFLQTATFAQTTTAKLAPSTGNDKQLVKKDVPTTGEKIESDMSEALSVIQEKYVDSKKIDYNELFKSSIDGMLHSLDPHSNYYDAKEFEQFRNDQNSQYFGIGASIGDLRDPDGNNVVTYIKATFENAPANRAGLRYGDKIIEVNGTSMVGKPYAEVRNFLRGPRGTLAKITVERYGTGKRETVEIIRDAVPQPSIPEAYMIRPGIGYIAMTGGFNKTTYDEFYHAMQDLKAQGMTQLILDLRNNPGGLVSQAHQIASHFLNRGQVIFTQKGRFEGTETYRSENRNPEKMPLVLLVNRGTASASEIFSGALQDHDRAYIIGEHSFGKALVMNPYLLEYGSMLMLVIAKYETPSGRLIQRDYSNGDLYDYYLNESDPNSSSPKPNGPEFKTDLGRSVYSGGGIVPDEIVKPATIPIERARQQAKLLDSIFAFSLDLTFGKVPGQETYRVDKPIKFNYDLTAADYSISDQIFQTYKKFAVEKYKMPAALVDKEKDYILRNLRSELVTAAFGITTSLQVYNDIDNQLQRAIEVLPKAKQLALESSKVKSTAENLK